ncbi:MAG TPA: NAD(P)H-binding protein [Thermoleophilaceae bacterium]|nr:NAD(P)H-binding protein [Thermoleophilaceae bacterium]
MTTIAVFGATGRTGKPFTKLALDKGYEVRALVRNPSKLEINDPDLTVIEGDLTDVTKVEETIRGSGAVLLLVGMSPTVRKPAHVRETAARNVLAAMEATGVKRLIRLSNFTGARAVGDKGGRFMRAMLSLMNKDAVADEATAANLVKESSTEWTIVRNAMITAGAPKGTYSVGAYGDGKNSVTAADLAAFILAEVEAPKHIGQMPFVRN